MWLITRKQLQNRDLVVWHDASGPDQSLLFCFAPLRYQCWLFPNDGQKIKRILYVSIRIWLDVFILRFMWAQTKCLSQISLVLYSVSLVSSKQTFIHKDLKKNYQICLHPFPPLHGRSSTTPHLHPGKHAAFNTYYNTLLLERDCWTQKYEEVNEKKSRFINHVSLKYRPDQRSAWCLLRCLLKTVSLLLEEAHPRSWEIKSADTKILKMKQWFSQN